MQVNPIIFEHLSPAQKRRVGADHYPLRTTPQFPDDAAYMAGWEAAASTVKLEVRK